MVGSAETLATTPVHAGCAATGGVHPIATMAMSAARPAAVRRCGMVPDVLSWLRLANIWPLKRLSVSIHTGRVMREGSGLGTHSILSNALSSKSAVPQTIEDAVGRRWLQQKGAVRRLRLQGGGQLCRLARGDAGIRSRFQGGTNVSLPGRLRGIRSSIGGGRRRTCSRVRQPVSRGHRIAVLLMDANTQLGDVLIQTEDVRRVVLLLHTQ